MFSLDFVRKRVAAGVLGFALLGVCTPGWACASEPGGSDVPAEPARAPSEADAGGSCVPREQCCKVCVKGKACGNTCIKAEYQCHKAAGCACDADSVCD